MPPEAIAAAVVNVPVLILAIVMAQQLAALRAEIHSLATRTIDSLDNALERSDPGRHVASDSFSDEETHDGDTKIVERPKPIGKRRK